VAKPTTKDPLLRLVNPVQDALNRMSYSDIARKSCMTLSFISLLFRGRRHAKAETLSKIAKVLGVTMDELHSHLSKLGKDGRRYGWGKAQVLRSKQRTTEIET
jgi:transcriptional regulator with XRE-family HTH domain